MMSGQPTEHFEKNMVSKPAMHEAQFTTAQFPKEWGGFFAIQMTAPQVSQK